MEDAGGVSVGKEAKSRFKGFLSSIPMVGGALSSAVDSVSILSDPSNELKANFSPEELHVLRKMLVNFAKKNNIAIKLSKEDNVFNESEVGTIHTMIANDEQEAEAPQKKGGKVRKVKAIADSEHVAEDHLSGEIESVDEEAPAKTTTKARKNKKAVVAAAAEENVIVESGHEQTEVADEVVEHEAAAKMAKIAGKGKKRKAANAA